MRLRINRLPLVSLLLVAGVANADEPQISADVVYGHKLGLAMTLDVYRPTKPANGAGVLFMVSGGWYSNWSPPQQLLPLFQPLLDEGFTVFSVRHGSSPRFTIPEAVSDVRRAVRFIRFSAPKWSVDPARLGVFGMSAGGHLSLMLGTTADDGDPQAQDEIEKVSDRVAAVVAFVAPSDLRIMIWDAPGHLPAYEKFPALSLGKEDAEKHSPLAHASADDAPTLLIAGDKDDLVPISHSQNMLKALQDQQVAAELMVVEGAGHGFGEADRVRAMAAATDWFQKQLAGHGKAERAKQAGHRERQSEKRRSAVRSDG